ncbi:hypothetical protein L228DRAFT_263732 [Xylona heveae TC161]|uniref:Calcium channel YVC1-like C-terminal transmembrane domain-containing protein n=1 Tax=Xylona heveae (strain CBS 132557 / TC161) TaxID=1328760 RepID=A0A164ZQZ7_XYLHT|nr:hypothetical protein L228DRAFT_263732 [Xylona heveae TC161]KZF19398.1 hypothetical protein L228DRAFT_263732 [Xylona heveae TC161]
MSETVVELPTFEDNEAFGSIVRKLSYFFVTAIETPHTFEDLRSSVVGRPLRQLVKYLTVEVHHPAIVSALLALKSHFASLDADDRGINDTRGLACEIVAWRFLAHLSEREVIDYLLYFLPHPAAEEIADPENGQANGRHSNSADDPDEQTHLLSRAATIPATPAAVPLHFGTYAGDQEDEIDLTPLFLGKNALEIAAIADAKTFLSQRGIQNVINGIWRGDIVFWESMSVHSTKKVRLYNKKRADPYCRLRVPKYLKVFQALFFASFLALYYAVLIQRDSEKIVPVEILLLLWIVAFAYDEFGELQDMGALLYVTDFWSIWDLGIICVGVAYLVARFIGVAKKDGQIVELSFDILSLEALLLVPRIFSLLSLNPFFGTLIPCLKQMTKDFLKFLSLVVILYLGFFTTFTLLARDQFTLREMSWVLIKVFFGSSYLGFDVAKKISPILGPALMLIFVCMTNILLVTSLISLLSNSLSKVMEHAREEYLFIYSVYVLEAASSDRLTYYYPPLNLIPLVLFRPLRLIMPAEKVRSARIVVLKITHAPFVLAIWAYESAHRSLSGRMRSSSIKLGGARGPSGGPAPSLKRSISASVVPSTAATKRDLLAPRVVYPSRSAQQRPTSQQSSNVDAPPEDLRVMVEKLSSQVSELASMLARQQSS